MALYEDKIEQALTYLKSPSKLSPTGNSPIVYITYQPEDVFTVRGLLNTYLAPKVEYYGFTPHYISLNAIIDDFITKHEYLDIWTDSSVTEEEMYESIKQEIARSRCIEKGILAIQDKYMDGEHPLIVIKDVEMLHPFYMMGVIENAIYNQVKIPMLVLYPGENQGTARSFMGVYNQDGNYRSINF